MRLVLRRLLWLGPMLLAITLTSFGILSSALPRDSELAELPLFFNPEPGAVERLATQALHQIVSSDGQQPEAERMLASLGGAALPYVLPALDAQSPEARARIARALRPIGVRLGFELDEHTDASREVLSWTRFWEEHAIDYRPSVARRAVVRLAQRSTQLRDTEVRQLDTYALDELIAQMPPEGAFDLERTRRLVREGSDESVPVTRHTAGPSAWRRCCAILAMVVGLHRRCGASSACCTRADRCGTRCARVRG